MALLDAILNMSISPMMPRWHHSVSMYRHIGEHIYAKTFCADYFLGLHPKSSFGNRTISTSRNHYAGEKNEGSPIYVVKLFSESFSSICIELYSNEIVLFIFVQLNTVYTNEAFQKHGLLIRIYRGP